MTTVPSEYVADGPRVALHPQGHAYPDVAVELLGRVADSLTGHPWHVATSLLDEGLLVFGLTQEQLQCGLAAERAVWRAAARQALNQFDLDGSDEANSSAIDEFSEAFLRAEQADLLLAAVCESAQIDRRDQASQDAPGCGVPPATSGASDAPEAPGHDLPAGGVVQA